MSVSDTHADTIRAGLLDTSNALVAGTMTETAFNGIAVLDALVAEVERERARADRAEAALREIVSLGLDRKLGLDNSINDARHKMRAIARAALSAGSGGREPT